MSGSSAELRFLQMTQLHAGPAGKIDVFSYPTHVRGNS
jgi:hypothetical protein